MLLLNDLKIEEIVFLENDFSLKVVLPKKGI